MIQHVAEKIRGIKLLVTDVDGVLTDGGMYYSESGEVMKKFDTHDGMGVELLKKKDIEVAIITSEDTEIVRKRAEKLGITNVFQGAKDKPAACDELRTRLGLDWDEIAYIGDDINDIALLGQVGFAATVSDASMLIKGVVDYVCSRPGGAAAFRELAELILSGLSEKNEVVSGAAAERENPAGCVQLGNKTVGKGSPTYVIAEVGINHNGDVDIAKRLIDVAVDAGCDAVKFQKRNPDVCIPLAQRDILKETPWGILSYIEYRKRVEFGRDEYQEIDRYCKKKGIAWFASCWDVDSVVFMEDFNPPCYKIPSACVTAIDLLERVREIGRTVILSTGMSTMDEIGKAVSVFEPGNLLIAHCNSTYPCPLNELNLRVIRMLEAEFGCVVGYSGHEVGLSPTWAAVTLGAAFVERHITLDRAMWGSDQAASVEPKGVQRLVEKIRDIEDALGDGVKRVYDSEKKAKSRLRRFCEATEDS